MIEADVELLNMGGSIATYATDNATPHIPFWPMVFKNLRVFLLGSDDFPSEAKVLAARAHKLTEHPTGRGRVVVTAWVRGGRPRPYSGARLECRHACEQQ